jgi:cytochrome c oxidase subunit 3
VPLPLFLRSVAGPGGATGVLAPPRTRELSARPRRSGPPLPPPDRGGSDDGGGRGGDGGGGAGWGDDGLGRLALGLALVGISTLFLVLIAVWLLLRRSSPDWNGPLPALDALWISTAFLAASSATIQVAACRSSAAGRGRIALRWLAASFALGAAFLVAQVGLWVRLWTGGTLPSSGGFAAVFFSLTGLHALHILGGLGFFAVLGVHLAHPVEGQRPPSLRLAAVYWHFMGGVWLVLFGLLYFVR